MANYMPLMANDINIGLPSLWSVPQAIAVARPVPPLLDSAQAVLLDHARTRLSPSCSAKSAKSLTFSVAGGRS
jgi:hypothetical protein